MKRPPTPREVETTVIAVLREECKVNGAIGRDTRLAEDLELDSVGLLTLSLEVENRYQMMLGEDPEKPPRTVGEVIDLVTLRLKEKEAGS